MSNTSHESTSGRSLEDASLSAPATLPLTQSSENDSQVNEPASPLSSPAAAARRIKKLSTQRAALRPSARSAGQRRALPLSLPLVARALRPQRLYPLKTPQRTGAARPRKRQAKRRHRSGASLWQSIANAFEALYANRLRSLLTTLGIIIGVGAVIVMISISQGASNSTASRLSTLGPNVLTVIPGASSVGGVRGGAGSRQTLTQADADAIASQVSNVSGVSPIVGVQGQIIFQNQNYQTRVQGVYPAYQQIGNWQIAEGAFFSDADESQSTLVAVIGQTIVQNLFTPVGADPVGQQMRIGSQTFTIVGVLATKGAGAGGDQDDVVYVPFSTAFERLSRQPFVSQIAVQASSAGAVNQVQSDIQQLLELRHNIPSGGQDDFSIRNQNQILQTVQGVTTTLTFLLVGVASVSLIVGGIGIMNIMLVSVTERTREIGIRIAVGARRRDVLSQFLIEALVLSGVGGMIGIAIGIIAAIEVSRLGNLPQAISVVSILLAFGFSALIGIVFGLYPAWRASRLDPITALRVE